jgi:short-subunit dehydrogenase
MSAGTEEHQQGLAVVTGASSGIGLAIARELVTHGYDVVAVAETAASDNTAAEIGMPSRVQTVSADLASDEGVESACEAVQATGRPVEVLVLNAGVGTSGDFVRDGDLQRELDLVRLNVLAPVHMAKRLMPEMVERGTGRVLVTSSVAATMPGPYEATYAASKAFLLSFAEAVRKEVADTGVTVTALLPGPTETNFFRRAGLQDTRLARMRKDDPAEVAHDGVRALLSGDDKVVAGSALNKAQALFGKLATPRISAAMHAVLAKPGSGKRAGDDDGPATTDDSAPRPRHESRAYESTGYESTGYESTGYGSSGSGATPQEVTGAGQGEAPEAGYGSWPDEGRQNVE